MINFRNVKFKNFLSTGNVITTIQLDRSPNTLVIGENGAGKSTMLDALCFSLFGKSFRKIKKSQLVNSVNLYVILPILNSTSTKLSLVLVVLHIEYLEVSNQINLKST